MKFRKIVVLAALIGSSWWLGAMADTTTLQKYNPQNHTPADKPREPGWTEWRSQNEIAGFDWGFSNMTLGIGLDMSHLCTEDAGDENFEYWYRFDDPLYRTGNDTVEIGCWYDGRFLRTWKVSDGQRSGWD